MADPDESQDVLGSLPRHRPGIKSPRRADAKASTAAKASAARRDARGSGR